MQIVKKIKVVYVTFIFFCFSIGWAFAADTDSLVVTENGNVGIGITSSGYKLHTYNASGDMLVKFETGSGQSHLYLDGAHNTYYGITIANAGSQLWEIGNSGETTQSLNFSPSSATPAMTILQAGNVGIGTTNPSEGLEVYAGSDTSKILWGQSIRNNGNTNVSGYGVGLKLKISSEGELYEVNKWAGIAAEAGTQYANRADMVFYVNPTSASIPVEKMRIQGDGNVGIGTTRPILGKLQVDGGSSPVKLAVKTTNTAEKSVALRLENSAGAFNDVLEIAHGAGLTHFQDGNGLETMTLNITNRRVGIGTTRPGYNLDVVGTIRGNNVSPSDARWKNDIETIDDALARVSQLRGVHYQWVDQSRGEGVQIGAIAQEVEKVFPEVVSTDNQGYKSVAYGKLVAPLIEAVKELKAENEDLRSKLEALSARIDSIANN